MGIYFTFYNNLCSSRSQLKESWSKGSGIHRHHIIPKHSGGLDEESNYTYFTVREHIISHFLLWKIYRNPNDLRAMKMLGANMTPQHRKIIGEWCRDNNIGFHNASPDKIKEWGNKGRIAQKEKYGGFFTNISGEQRKINASQAGKMSFESGNNKEFHYWSSVEGRLERSSLGGKSHIGKIWVQNGVTRTRINPNLLEDYLKLGFIKGYRIIP